jgi:hypothetical protein
MQGESVSDTDISAGDGKIANLFFTVYCADPPGSPLCVINQMGRHHLCAIKDIVLSHFQQISENPDFVW